MKIWLWRAEFKYEAQLFCRNCFVNKKYKLQNRILIVVNSAWNVVNFRLGLIEGLESQGYHPIVAAPSDIDLSSIKALGCEFHNVGVQPQSLNPLNDLGFMLELFFLMRKTNVVACLFFTAKPNIFGGFCASLWGLHFINNISGLGSIFIENGLLSKVLVFLYKLALKRSSCVFFQNQDDRELFLQKKIVKFEQTQLLPGSGVNLQKFQPSGKSRDMDQTPFSFVLIARLIKDKGVVEYIEASKLVSKSHPFVQFKLLGFLGVQNPTAISTEQMSEWEKLPFIHYSGSTEDVRPFIEESDCVVLPSYREGTPKVLLEAAAMGKPIITTDVPGCREVVEDQLTGFLCEVKSAQDLAQKMCQMIELSVEQRAKMGRLGRLKIEKQFSEKIVVDRYLEVIRSFK